MPTPPRKTGKTRKRLSKSSNSPDSHRDRVAEHRERELAERAKHDSAVRKQLIQLMEEDPELIEIYSKHLQRKHGKNWDNFNPKIQAEKIKEVMEQYRIPQSKRGGRRRTKRRLKKRGKSRKIRKSRKKKKGGINISRQFSKYTGMHKNIYSNIRHKLRIINNELDKPANPENINDSIDIQVINRTINELNNLLDDDENPEIKKYKDDVHDINSPIYTERGNDNKTIHNLRIEIQNTDKTSKLGESTDNLINLLLRLSKVSLRINKI